MRYLFATGHSYLPQRAGGSESSTHELCLALAEQGHEVGVLAAVAPRGSIGRRYLSARLRRPSERLTRDEAMGYPVFRGLRPRTGVAEAIGRFRPSVVVVQAGRPLALAAALLDVGVPTVVYLRDAIFDRLGGPARSDPKLRYLATSRFLVERFSAHCGIQAARVPPLVRPERYRVDSARENVTFVCPVRRKGIETALGLARRRPDIPFVFVEAWPLNPLVWRYTEGRVRRCANVTLLRRTDDMRTVYRATRVLLVPSRWVEAWGRVVTEVQLSGIPVLASDLGGLPESVGPGGLLVSPEAELDEWERALSRLWDVEAEYARRAEAALEHSRRPEIATERLLEDFQGVVAELVAAAGAAGAVH